MILELWAITNKEANLHYIIGFEVKKKTFLVLFTGSLTSGSNNLLIYKKEAITENILGNSILN